MFVFVWLRWMDFQICISKEQKTVHIDAPTYTHVCIYAHTIMRKKYLMIQTAEYREDIAEQKLTKQLNFDLSTLVISKSKGFSEIFRVIRTLTYQIAEMTKK